MRIQPLFKIKDDDFDTLGPFDGFKYYRDKGMYFILPEDGLYVFRAGTPRNWTAPNGVLVQCQPNRAPNHFHCDWDGERWYYVDTGVGGNRYPVAVARHRRHLGPARRALRAFAREFVVDRCTQAFRLRQLVRPGD